MPTLIPETTATLTSLRGAARECRARPTWKHATRTVVGKRSPRAKFLMIGEQADDQENMAAI